MSAWSKGVQGMKTNEESGFRPMTSEEYLRIVRDRNLNLSQLARLLRQGRRTVTRYANEDDTITGPITILMRAIGSGHLTVRQVRKLAGKPYRRNGE